MAASFQLGLGDDPLRTKIDQVLAEKTLPPFVKRILVEVAVHRGVKDPIPLRDLVSAAKTADVTLTERELKGWVKHLVEEFGIPIGASRTEPTGYYLAVSAGDITAAIAPYLAEIRSLARRVRALAGEHRMAELLGQISLELAQQPAPSLSRGPTTIDQGPH